MILLAGIPSEPPIALAALSAEALHVPYLFLNQRMFAHDDLVLQFAEGACQGWLVIGRESYSLDRFTGIYARMIEPESLPGLQIRPQGDGEDLELATRARAWSETFNAWLEIAQQRIVNRPSAMLSNFSKPFQSQIIQASGFAIPETLITNDPEAVRSFLTEHCKVIYKSTSSIRSVVSLLDEDAIRRLERIRSLPTQFQEFIPGENVRVHVVGDDVFGTRIATEAVDYRYAHREGLPVIMEPIKLPEAIRERCLDLSDRLQLPLCGIDFKVTPDGTYICFEVNPSPAFSFYQEQTGAPISDALVRFLIGHRPNA